MYVGGEDVQGVHSRGGVTCISGGAVGLGDKEWGSIL